MHSRIFSLIHRQKNNSLDQRVVVFIKLIIITKTKPIEVFLNIISSTDSNLN